MFRKTTFMLAAAAVMATAALPTAASASHWRDGWRLHHRPNYGVTVRYAPHYAYSRQCITKKRWVRTQWSWRVHRVCR